MTRPAHSGLLSAAGLGTWAIMATGAVLSARIVGVGASAAWALFPAAFIVSTLGRSERRLSRWVALVLQSVAALAATATGGGTFAGVLLAVVAGQAPLVVPVRIAALGCFVQTIVYGALFSLEVPTRSAIFTTIGYAAFQLFALGAAWLAQRESAARAELARVNAELRATQALLAERTRDAERLRISRELHDTLGHHLTALSLQLELARNSAPANDAVLRAQGLAREMLSEVRTVVSTLREPPPLDLRRALQALVQDMPVPAVHLTLPERLEVRSPEAAQTLFRCAQEGLTNALRHAHAQHVWIEVDQRPGRVELVVRDDGRGPGTAGNRGNGLKGLHERLAAIGGELVVSGAPDSGFQLTAWLPLPERAT